MPRIIMYRSARKIALVLLGGCLPLFAGCQTRPAAAPVNSGRTGQGRIFYVQNTASKPKITTASVTPENLDCQLSDALFLAFDAFTGH